MVAATSGAQYTVAPSNADEPRMWSKWLCVNTIWLTSLPAISATSALIGGRFGQRRAGVDQQRARRAVHQADGDVEERQTAAMNAVAQPFPGEVHGSGLTQRQRLRQPILVEHLAASGRR